MATVDEPSAQRDGVGVSSRWTTSPRRRLASQRGRRQLAASVVFFLQNVPHADGKLAGVVHALWHRHVDV